MTAVTDTQHEDWRTHARRLADTLAERGDVQSHCWGKAVAAVPRHLFVPYAYDQDPRTGEWSRFSTAEPLDRVYSPETLIIALEPNCDGQQEPVSSSTKPDLMLRMLEILDVRDGDRVLEIGTGSGYNAALLSERFGEQNVFTVDIDDELTSLARHRLAAAGYQPTITTADGAGGLSSHAPFDRIVATCSVPRVPWVWAEQLAAGRVLLVDVKLGPSAGNLVLLRRFGDRLEGWFTRRWAGFMAMRSATGPAHPAVRTQPASDGVRERHTVAGAEPWKDAPVVWFLAQLRLPAEVRFGYDLDPDTFGPVASRLSAPDGSWVRVDHSDGVVTEAGPTPIWHGVEWATAEWEAIGRQGWERLGLTVGSDGEHQLWVDDPVGPHRWKFASQ